MLSLPRRQSIQDRPRDRVRPGAYLFGAILSTLFGISVGTQIERGLGTFLGGLAATLLWGFATTLAGDARERVRARLRLLPAWSGALRGTLYLLAGASPFLGGTVSRHHGGLSAAIVLCWALYTAGIVHLARGWVVAPFAYRGPFSFLADLWTRTLAVGRAMLWAILACGLAAGIATGEAWLRPVGYLIAVCGAMAAMGVWFPGRATRGFEEGLGVMAAVLPTAGAVGWLTYFVVTG